MGPRFPTGLCISQLFGASGYFFGSGGASSSFLFLLQFLFASQISLLSLEFGLLSFLFSLGPRALHNFIEFGFSPNSIGFPIGCPVL